MATVLLDSNALLFALYKSKQLGKKATASLEQADGCYVSIASVWELAIKYNEGLLKVSPKQLLDGVAQLGFNILSIEPKHLTQIEYIELPQKDPFDRLLVAQAKAEGMVFMTSDQHILASSYRTFDAAK